MLRFLTALLLGLVISAAAIAAVAISFRPATPAASGHKSPPLTVKEKVQRLMAFEVVDQPANRVLDALAKKYGVPITVDDPGGQGGFPARPFAHVSHQVPRLTLGNAIELVAREIDREARVEILDDGVHIVPQYIPEKRRITRFFITAAHTGRLGARNQDLAELIISEIDPDSWNAGSGAGCLEAEPGGIAVVNRPAAMAEIAQLLDCLETLATADDLRPVWVRAENPADEAFVKERLQARLEPLPEFNKTQPFAKVLALMERQMGVPVVLDVIGINEIGASATQDIAHVQTGVPWESSLRIMLRPMDLTFTEQHGAIFITTPDQVYNKQQLRAYPVGDVLRAAPQAELDDLMQLITSTVHPESWNNVGGKGSLSAIGTVLLVRQMPEAHQKLEALLGQLRRVLLHGEKGPLRSDLWANSSPEDKKLLVALDRIITLNATEAPFGEVCQQLGEKLGIPIVIDKKAIEAIGASVDTPVTIHREHWPLRDCLRTLLRPMDLTYVVRDSVLYITTPEEACSKLITHVYGMGHLFDPVEGVFEPAKPDAVIDLITSTIQPSTWDAVGGNGASSMFGEALVISQSFEVLEQVTKLFAGLEAYQDRPASLAPLDIIVPLAMPQPPPRVQAKLAEKVNWNYSGQSMPELNQYCREEYGISFSDNDTSNILNAKFACRFHEVPLATALDIVLSDFDVPYQLDYDQLVNVERDPIRVRLYPAADFLPPASATHWQTNPAFPVDFDAFHELLVNFIAPETWNTNRSTGNVAQLRQAVLVAQRPRQHQQIEQFLADFRAAKQLGNNASTPLVAGKPFADELLARKVTLDIETNSIQDFARQLGEKLHVSVYCSQRLDSDSNVVCHEQDRPLAEVLRRALNGRFITCTVRNGVLILDLAVHADLETRIYNVSALLKRQGQPAEPVANGADDYESGLEIAVQSVGPAETWKVNGGMADVRLWENCLVVRHSTLGQYEVQQFLAGLGSGRKWPINPEGK